MNDVPVLAQKASDKVIGSPHLLQSDHIGLGRGQPFVHAFAGGGPEAIDIDGRDSQHLSIVSRSGFRWGRLAR